jgi:hypothetical protein
MELMMALTLGKRLVVLAQCLEDIPADLRGRVRPIIYEPEGLGVHSLIKKLKDELEVVRGDVVTENNLVPLRGTTAEPMPGTVVLVTKERAVVETDDRGCRQLLELSNADVDYTRLISDMTRRFKVDDRLSGAVVTVEDVKRYTLLADQSNPWRALRDDYPPGKIFTSRVANVREGVGAFISVAHGIDGFMPFAEAKQANLTQDAQVEVEVLRVDETARQVRLRLRNTRAATHAPARQVAQSPDAPADLPSVGMQLHGRVFKAVPEQDGRGGFLLLRLAGYEHAPAILHRARMSQDLREDLNDAEIDLHGEEIKVEVIRVQRKPRRIELLELPEPDEADIQAAAA